MSHKQRSSDYQLHKLIDKCLVIVFKEKRSKKCEDQNSKIPLVDETSLFEQFIDENKECYWNPHLEESINNIRHLGFIQPHSLLIGGRDIYIETIRAAWSRRVLRAPGSLVISKVGFLEDVAMTVIPQTQFTPLPEVLCLVISKLARDSATRAASLEAILQELAHRYHGMQQPSEHLVYQALGSLCSEGNVFHTGAGYHINKPNMDHLTGYPVKGWNSNMPPNGTTVNGLPSPPLPVPPPGEVCSVSCQTEQPRDVEEKVYDELQKTLSEGEVDDSIYDKPGPAAGRRLQRSLSLRASKKGDRSTSLQRTASLRPGSDKSTSAIKDINLKTSNVHREKDKGEKQSMLKKLFGRNKQPHQEKKNRNKDSPPQTDTVTPISAVEQETTPNEEKQVELATFSAQFPPPEWQWYESQHRQEQFPASSHLPHLGRSHTWDSQARYTGPHLHGCAYATNTPGAQEAEEYLQARMTNSLPPGLPEPHGYPGMNGVHEYFNPPHPQRGKLCSSSSEESFSVRPADRQRPTSPVKHHNYHRRPSRKHSRGRKNSTRRHTVMESDGEESNLYCEPEFQHDAHHEGGLKKHQGPSETNLDTPDGDVGGNKPNLPPPRNLVHYKKRGLPDHFGNDISIRYHGRMPRRNTGCSLSRDSGVNCIGLTEAPCFPVDRTPSTRKNGWDDAILNNRNMKNSIPQAASTPRENNLIVHQATVHEGLVKLPQDSGFSSPRLEAETSLAQQRHHETFTKFHHLGKSDRDKCKTRRGSASKQKRNIFLSSDSLEITGSEFYPSYHGGIIPDHQSRDNQGQKEQQQPGSSSISTSSTNQTVLERPGYQKGVYVGDTSEKQSFSGIGDDKHEELRFPNDSGNVHVHPDVQRFHGLNNESLGLKTEKDKVKYSALNNNVRMNNFSVADKDAYKPKLYRCCGNNDAGAKNSNEVPMPLDKTSHVAYRHLSNSQQHPQNTSDRPLFPDNCQVVGVL